MAMKKYLSLDRLTEYDELIKAKIDDGDVSTLESAKQYTDDAISNKADKTDIVQADWNQNDPEALDYVKNRPFYISGDGENVLLREVSVETYDYMPYHAFEGYFTLEEGKTYTVSFNGVKYECVAWYHEYDDAVIIGNGTIYDNVNYEEDCGGYGKGNNEPFAIECYLDDCCGLSTTEIGSYTIEISTISQGIVQLDEKFIPYTAGRKTEAGTYTYTYPFTDESVEFSSSLGGEIFNDYKNNIALNNGHAEGNETVAVGEAAHAEGRWAVASGDVSHAEGVQTNAAGFASHAEGSRTTAASDYQHVQGTNNIPDEEGRYAHIVGNGNPQFLDQFSNAHTLDWEGNAWFAGDVYVGGDNQDNAAKLMTEADMSWDNLQNKPFGDIVIEDVIIPETNFTGTQYSFSTDIESFVVGETYTVIFDGVVYPDLVCASYNGVPAIGRVSQETSHLTFMIGIRNGSASAMSMNGGDHSISVLKYSDITKTIDPKYLPEMDMSGYESKDDAQAKLDEAKLYTDNKISAVNTSITNITNGSVVVKNAEHATNADTAETANSAVTANSATKATQDGNGNTITSTYETKTDATAKLDEAKAYTDTKVTGMATTTVVDNKISEHNTSSTAHSDIRDLITALTTKVNNFLDVDDTTTDQLSEVLTLIENNKGTLESLTSSKVNVSDIVDNLTTSNDKKVLSAKQGVAIKALIDALQEVVDGKADDGHKHTISDVTNLQATLDAKALQSDLDALELVVNGKSDEGHGHAIADVSGLQTALDGKSAVGHGHSISEITNLQSTLDAKATQTSLDTHTSNTTVHITADERTKWNAAKTHADSAHAPSDAQANVIESIKVNGTAQTITSKSVNITVPTDNSQLANGAGYITASAIANKADKADTLSGYGITDAYTKAEVDAKTVVDTALSSTSTNPVQNKVVNDAIVTATNAILANTNSINAHTDRITALETKVGEGFEEITSEEIQNLFK